MKRAISRTNLEGYPPTHQPGTQPHIGMKTYVKKRMVRVVTARPRGKRSAMTRRIVY